MGRHMSPDEAQDIQSTTQDLFLPKKFYLNLIEPGAGLQEIQGIKKQVRKQVGQGGNQPNLEDRKWHAINDPVSPTNKQNFKRWEKKKQLQMKRDLGNNTVCGSCLIIT